MLIKTRSGRSLSLYDLIVGGLKGLSPLRIVWGARRGGCLLLRASRTQARHRVGSEKGQQRTSAGLYAVDNETRHPKE
jgi:hypothetical protein